MIYGFPKDIQMTLEWIYFGKIEKKRFGTIKNLKTHKINKLKLSLILEEPQMKNLINLKLID